MSCSPKKWLSSNSYATTTTTTTTTTNIADLCQPVASVGSRQRLRSATRGDLVSGHSSNVHLLRRPRSFPVAGPTAWNQLPADVRSTESVNSFKTVLKTFLFCLSADWSPDTRALVYRPMPNGLLLLRRVRNYCLRYITLYYYQQHRDHGQWILIIKLIPRRLHRTTVYYLSVSSTYSKKRLDGFVFPESIFDCGAPLPDELNHSTFIDQSKLSNVSFTLSRRHVRMIGDTVRNNTDSEYVSK